MRKSIALHVLFIISQLAATETPNTSMAPAPQTDTPAPPRYIQLIQWAIQKNSNAPLAPPLYQQLLQFGIKILNAHPKLPPVRCDQYENCYMCTNGAQIWINPKYLRIWRLDNYGAKKGGMLHEIVHTLQREDAVYSKETDQFEIIYPKRFLRGIEQEADTLAIEAITCPQCADGYAQSRPMQHSIDSWRPAALWKNYWYHAHHSDHEWGLQKGYLSYEEACKIVQEKMGGPLCGYHNALAGNTLYKTSYLLFPVVCTALAYWYLHHKKPKKTRFKKFIRATLAGGTVGVALAYLTRFAIQYTTMQRVARGELNP